MADRPILFSGVMVRSLLAGTKTQTRRVLSNDRFASLFNGEWADSYVLDPGNVSWREKEVRFAVGDRLYVREAWQVFPELDKVKPSDIKPTADVLYVADRPDALWDSRFRQGMHMPRWASRMTLIVTDVRVQRLQDISEEDAIAEGVGHEPPGRPAIVQYLGLWDSLNADRGFGWATNPWIVAVTFEVKHGNIDQIGGAS